MKKPYLLTLSVLLLAGSIIANPINPRIAHPIPPEIINSYEDMDVDFMRTRYFEIHDWRPIHFEGVYKSKKWIPPYQYKERLSEIGFDVNDYHVLQFTMKEKDDYHYAFPVLLFKTKAGDLTELDQLDDLAPVRVGIYGRFFNLKKSEYAVEVDLVETIEKGGHFRDILLDARVAPTFTPTATITNTPGPNIFQKIGNWVNPKETATPTGTTTPGPNR